MNDEIWGIVYEHSREDYPAECCGIITEDEKGILEEFQDYQFRIPTSEKIFLPFHLSDHVNVVQNHYVL